MDEYDTPYYGATKKSTRIIQWSIAGFLAVWVVYCLAIAIWQGLSHYEHFVMAFLLICTVGHLIVAFIFYKMSDQEETKFLWNCIICVIMIILCGIVLNVYVWVNFDSGSGSSKSGSSGSTTNCPSTNCTTTNGYYSPSGHCVGPCTGDAPYIDPIAGQCVACPACGNGTGNNGTGNGTNSSMYEGARKKYFIDLLELTRALPDEEPKKLEKEPVNPPQKNFESDKKEEKEVNQTFENNNNQQKDHQSKNQELINKLVDSKNSNSL
eukprot:TRINITY_DN92164_c0_g1_i1.p1 TRINITY_DN92164_c0_g1~~TRINITY_DN92164_c0_g1_i1.p1  ORF type:complete len:266 (-),score=49.49 TRINITY_DN92164_c0_g1_i1:192-989(-)